MADSTANAHKDHLRWEQEHLQWSADHARALAVLHRTEAHLLSHEAEIIAHRAEILRHEEALAHEGAQVAPPHEEHEAVGARHASASVNHSKLIDAIFALEKVLGQK
jgi:hypothetical protein